MQNIRPDIDYLNPNEPGLRDFIDLCLEELEDRGEKILMIFDGFDHVLSRPGISRELWDTLRSFAQRRSLVLVTGSRNNLRELCRSEDSRTSDFWEIFYDSPIQVQAFEDQDWPELLEAFDQRGITGSKISCLVGANIQRIDC